MGCKVSGERMEDPRLGDGHHDLSYHKALLSRPRLKFLSAFEGWRPFYCCGCDSVSSGCTELLALCPAAPLQHSWGAWSVFFTRIVLLELTFISLSSSKNSSSLPCEYQLSLFSSLQLCLCPAPPMWSLPLQSLCPYDTRLTHSVRSGSV